jgi:hypothetical protein
LNPYFAAFTALAVLPASASLAAPATATREAPQIGRCFMGGCSWFRIVRRQTVRTVGGERLLRITLAEGGSEHPATREAPRTARQARIRWDAASDDTYFLCSARRPSAIMTSNGAWEAVRLDFVNGPYGPTEAVSQQYVAACHPGDSLSRRGFAARRGYRAIAGDAEAVTLARPEDIFATGR